MSNSSDTSAKARQSNGVVIGHIFGIRQGLPEVIFVGNPSDKAILAKSLIAIGPEDIGSEVAIGFEGDDASKPMVIGKLLHPITVRPENRDSELLVSLDETPPQPLDVTAQDQLTLRCGKASITLTKEGKIILRGTYISSRSSGPNRIKGGSVHLN